MQGELALGLGGQGDQARQRALEAATCVKVVAG
jgi:hypothetical protein